MTYVIIIALVVLLLGGVGLVGTRTRSRRRLTGPQTPRRLQGGVDAPLLETTTSADVAPAAEDRDTSPSSLVDGASSDTQLSPGVLTGTPALDVPEPAAGRMVRLRSRLSRSEGALGRGLLALLSRDVLDESVWEQVEETHHVRHRHRPDARNRGIPSYQSARPWHPILG